MYPFFPEFLGIRIPLYGIMTALGYTLAIWYCMAKRETIGLSKDNIWDIMFALVMGAIVGGKLFFIALNWDTFITMSVLDKIRFGFVFYGGFIGAALVAYFYTRKLNVSLLKFADFIVPAIALGHSVGRIGCFLAGCCYGKESHSFLAVHFHNHDSLVPEHLHDVPLYPTQLMEAVCNFILFLILARLYKKDHKTGTVAAAYVIGYGIIRFVLEFFRGDDRGNPVFGLAPSQFIALILIAIVCALLLKRKFYERK